MTDPKLVSRARYALAISVAATLLLYTIPQLHAVAYPLILLSTLFHELGHGVAALLAGGTFDHFVMYPDGSGLARVRSAGSLAQAFTSAGGLVGPAMAAAVCFVCARRPGSARYCLAAIGLVLVLAMILVVRNAFGLAFVGIFAAVCLLLAFKAGNQLAQIGLVFVAVQLALSVYSRGDYLFTKWAETAQGRFPSDAQNIATAMKIGPYWFWGGVCGAFSIIVLLAGSWYFLRGVRRPVIKPLPSRQTI